MLRKVCVLSSLFVVFTIAAVAQDSRISPSITLSR